MKSEKEHDKHNRIALFLVTLAPYVRAAAARDLAEVFAWLSQPESATRSAPRAADKDGDHLPLREDPPCLFAFGQHRGRREFTAEGYRIVYRVNPDTGLNGTAGDVEYLVFGPGQSRETLCAFDPRPVAGRPEGVGPRRYAVCLGRKPRPQTGPRHAEPTP